MLVFCFRAIINHFNPKIESYAAVNHISQLSEEQVSHYSPQSDPTVSYDRDSVIELPARVARTRLLRGIN